MEDKKLKKGEGSGRTGIEVVFRKRKRGEE